MKGYTWKQYESFAKSLDPNDATRFWLMVTVISTRRTAQWSIVAALGVLVTSLAVIFGG